MIADPKRKPHQDDGDSDKRRRQEEALDEALENTFPASDPVSVEQPTTYTCPLGADVAAAARVPPLLGPIGTLSWLRTGRSRRRGTIKGL
jgi:hypothetical protein